jgi:ubiquinone/menaquinone biosynthesis C-methylase UbiE
MLSKLSAKFETHYGAKLIVSQGDVHFLSLGDASIDAAICNGVYPHFHNKPKVLAELFRVLKPNGGEFIQGECREIGVIVVLTSGY